MAGLTSEVGSWLPAARHDWRDPLERYRERRAPITNLQLAGAVVLGVGLPSWPYLGPDLRRYLKIHRM